MSEKKENEEKRGGDGADVRPESAPLVDRPGHKLRSARSIVDRAALNDISHTLIATDERIVAVTHEDQVGVMRCDASDAAKTEIPNMFTGPSYRTAKERFRFDGHKMIYHMDRVLAWQKGERVAPLYIDMGLTKFCDTACIYCYAVVQNMTKGVMIGREALLRYIEDCGRLGVKGIGFVGDGEPTLNPAVYDATLAAARVGVDTGMATNGLSLDMDRADDLLANMSWIRFNLSAGDGEGFRRVHQSSPQNFEVVVEKIAAMTKLKKEKGYDCTLGLQMVLIPECFDQVMKEVDLGARLGVDYFVIKQCSDSEYHEIGVDYKEYESMMDVLAAAEKLSTNDYVVQVKWDKISAAGESMLYKDGYRKYDVCYGTPFVLQISGNGKVYPCGPFFNKERFYIGDLHTDSFASMVMGDRYWEVHEDVQKSVDVHKDCAIGCRQDYVNKFLWDLKNPPEHLNFI